MKFQLWHLQSLEAVNPILTARKCSKNWKSITFLRDIRELRLQGKLTLWHLESQANPESQSQHFIYLEKKLQQP